MISWLEILVWLGLPVLIYFGFFWRINWVRHLDHKKRFYARVDYRRSRQCNPVYPNGWFAILDSHELKKKEVKHVSALGENLAVYRTKKGEVHILDAYCPHLGANMAEGGKVIGNCLQCPFHDWSFRPDGNCDNIPYSNKIPPNAKVRAWKSLEVNNLIFMWYHAEMEDPGWYPEPIAQIADGSYRCQGRNEYHISAHIQEIPENGADWAHLTALHGPAILVNSFLPGLFHHSWTATDWQPRQSHDGTPGCPHEAYLTLSHDVVLFGKFSILKLHITAVQIGPGYVHLTVNTSVGPMFIVQTVTPIEPFLLRVTHSVYCAPWNALFGKIIFLGECIMFERDVHIWNHKEFLKNPLLLPEEKKIKAFRKWYSQFYSPNSPTYQSIKSLEW
ncbi:cholesterol desaturase daf-36 [Fopius arisanus]|uniref:cholesterol 7-desaturase n=1 Tax=Fopius arisanus TaxID=64838 RepID=A0A0C9R9F7_9HYME|nr:PREDICTED: cholesterol desaturase daf-36-like [Fopius arisanus]